MGSNFYDVFPRRKILLGMLHLAGRDARERLHRALEEIDIYRKEGFDGAIVEDYAGGVDDVVNVLKALPKVQDFVFGVNILRNPYFAFDLASLYGAKFVQFDTIQTSRTTTIDPRKFNEEKYNAFRKKYPNICVLGGVRFKYIPPTGKSLEEDIKDGKSKADVIVTTGDGTGIETPIQKLIDFRKEMKLFPFFVGAGVNSRNIKEQMEICDGAIIGSYVKDGDIEKMVIRERVCELTALVRG
jgi:predicted TIM-barrel enzyme